MYYPSKCLELDRQIYYDKKKTNNSDLTYQSLIRGGFEAHNQPSSSSSSIILLLGA